MYRRFPKAITNFKVREVFPPFRFSQPFPTVCMVKHSALAAQSFHITTAAKSLMATSLDLVLIDLAADSVIVAVTLSRLRRVLSKKRQST